MRSDTPGPHDEPVQWGPVRLAAHSHAVPARVYRPARPLAGWLVWAHGGSWQTGSAADWHHATADLARASGWTVVSVDYRLAPEYTHPAGLDDVLTAVRWARGQAAAESEGDPPVVAVGGDSAGGTLAACAALVLRDRGERLAAQVLAYPPLDPACDAPSYRTAPAAFPTADWLRSAWRAYRGTGTGEKPRNGSQNGAHDGLYSSPLEAAGRLGGLAPALLAVGDADPVRDEVTDYARQLRAAGNTVTLKVFAGAQHGAFLQPAAAAPRPGGFRPWLGSRLRQQLTHRPGPAT